LLRDEIGRQFADRYLERFGPGATPQVGCQSYTSMHHYAVAASIAAGTAGPGEFEHNRKVARALRDTVYRGVVGAVRYHPEWQAAVPYPDFVQDPSLGMPHLFYQVQDRKGRLGLIAPEPYNTEHFVTPSWFTPSSRPR
jgi:branched-chain amino acid transport system substrate-binding protein